MEVRLLVSVVCVCALFFSVITAKNVNSKPGTFEDTYGDSVDAENKDIQNDDDYTDYGGLDGDESAPDEKGSVANEITAEFQSKPQVFGARTGDVVRLPCEISNPDLVVVWKKDETELLYQGDFAVKTFPNVKKTSKGLEVNVTSDSDYGKYSCLIMISDDNNPNITHTIIPPSPPVISLIQAGGNRTVYNVGDTLELSCMATGFPTPVVSWHLDNKRIQPSGENITIPDLKAHNAGVYRCLADNGIAPPAHQHIVININHKPVVSVDKYLVNSNHESDAELKCTVHAYPPPAVSWKKNGMNIGSNPPKVTLKRHENNVENILIITNLTEADFGEYTCSASNGRGKTEQAVSLVKVPVVREFVKPEKTNKDVVLTWKVESKTPITEHQLQYRKKGETEWRKVKPEVSYDGQNDAYMVKYTLKGLEPGNYETRARSQNAHGWSNYSDILPFEGVLAKNTSHHKHHKKHHKEKDLKEKQAVPVPPTQVTPAQHQENESSVGASQTDGCATVTSSIFLTTSIALLALWYRQ